MEAAESSDVEQGLDLAVSARQGVALSGDEVVGAACRYHYYWMRAMGYSATPPKKSVRFWYSMND